MPITALLIPDFALIVLGLLLGRFANWGKEFWSGLEKLVYFVLFPVLLFYSTAKSRLDFAASTKMLQVVLFSLAVAVALGWLARVMFKAGPMMFESGVQTAFRFNSYIGFALAFRLGGDKGTSLMAIIIGLSIPICNAAAVYALVHKSGGLGRELARNPLLIATVLGLLFNVSGLMLPELAGTLFSRIGNASIALGLMLVGAGLRMSGIGEGKAMAAWFLLVKLIAYPTIALIVGRWAQLSPLQLQMAVLFAALPTASSAYVLATRMGGNGPFVSFLVSASTALSALTLPFWLLMVG